MILTLLSLLEFIFFKNSQIARSMILEYGSSVAWRLLPSMRCVCNWAMHQNSDCISGTVGLYLALHSGSEDAARRCVRGQMV